MTYQDTNNQFLGGRSSGQYSAGLAVGEQQGAFVACSTSLVKPRFTESENPYLFPSHLLDPWTDPSTCDNSPNEEIGEYEVVKAETSSIDTNDAEIEVEDPPQWWLVHSKPRQEKKLAMELRRLQISHFLPVTKCTAVTRGRARINRLPQFPSYLFLWANRNQRLVALETNRIVAAYSVGCHEELGRHLWDLADLIEKGVPLRVEERLAAGQNVRVKSGLLEDKRGTIIKRGGKTRLFVFVSEMLGGVSLEIEQHLLEPY